MMTRLALVLTLGLVCIGAPSANAQTDRPNFVIVVVDDMRWDDFGAGGHPFVETPNVDRVAREGMMFTNAFTTTPLCSPARASLLTGLYAHTHGIIDNTDRAARSHELDTFPQRLDEAGYDTAFVGKWHMGSDGSRRPGFDYWVSLSGQGSNEDPLLTEGDAQRTVDGHVTDIFTDRAIGFLERRRAEPFLLYFAHKALHPDPRLGLVEGGFIAAERHRGIYDDEHVTRRPSAGVPPLDKPALMRKIQGLPPLGLDTSTSDRTIRDRMEMMAGVDESVGELLQVLERRGELDDTVFIVTSDHGYFYGEHGLDPQRRLAYEETARIPLLIRYPAEVEAGRAEDATALNIDLAPTVLAMAGLGFDHTQGVSLLPVLRGEPANWRTSFIIEHYTDPPSYLGGAADTADSAPRQVSEFVRVSDMGYKAVRGERYKYIQYADLVGMDELYDLQADPYELENIAGTPEAQSVLAEMRAELARLLAETE